ncbi:uncharacterized protein LOC123498421 [Portunus trituberculatus]|uniref:uncharacterized protein LOC123498421 n=1 Tax=Portunus trituberculatus TaxID=210409 RepID=UPI001E1CD852|nr:uncharacterized protein LOC123498421 [Portunus trituberculatus]
MALSFMLWNARSLLRKTQELETHLGDTLPSVVGICETWLPLIFLSFPGYNIIRKDRGQGRGGGVLLAIHDSLVSSPLLSLSLKMGVWRLLRQGWTWWWLAHGGSLLQSWGTAGHREFMHYFSALQPPVLIMGDFNAHHTCWEPDLSPHHHNTSGNALFQALLDLKHVSLLSPPGLATRFHPHTGAASVLDLFLGDPTFKDSTFCTGPYMGSDHLPLLASLPQVSPQPQPGCMPRWRLNSSGWPQYVAVLPPHWTPNIFPWMKPQQPLLGCCPRLAQLPSHSSPVVIHAALGSPGGMQPVRRQYRTVARLGISGVGPPLSRLAVLTAAWTPSVPRPSSRQSEMHGTCTAPLSFRSSPKSTMSFLRSMEGKFVSQNIPFSDDDSTPLADPEKAKILSEHFHLKIGLPPPLRPPPTLTSVIETAVSSPALPSLAQPFKPHELSSALATLKPAYRPISLLSCIGKLLERLVNTRLTWWLEANNKLAEEQCGFRPHRSTLDVLGQIEYHICDTYRQRQVMMALFLDLEGAFDSAPHEGILYKLALMGITGTTLAWVRDFLTGHSFQVAVGASLSPSQGIHRGVPQGSILSPLLFNVLLSDLQVPTHSHLLYADDITIISRAPTLSEAQDHLQEAATAWGAWMTTWGLQVSASKSSLMCFTMKKLPTPPTVNLSGEAVPYSTSHTLLGLRLDGPRLSWVNHISYLRTSCNKRLDVMKRIAGIRWGASRDLLLHYYKTTIRAKMQYASCFYGSAAYSNLLKLDPIQNAALRISMGAMSSSPVVSLQAESGIPPLSTHRRMTLCQQYYRILGLPASHPLSTLHSNSGVDQQAPVWLPAARQPLIVRALLSLTILHLPPPPPQPVNPYSPFPSWLDVTHNFALHVPGLPPKPSVSGLAAAHFQQLDRSIYHHHLKIYTDGSRDASLPSSAAAIYDASTAICKTWRLPEYTDVLTTELFALLQALIYLRTSHPKSMVVIYTDSRSSLSLLLSRQPSSATTLVHSIQNTFLHLLNTGWDITFQWLHSAKRLLSRLCHSSWDSSLNNALRVTSMGLYRSDSSPQPWVRKQSRILDVALTRLRLGHTRLTAHLHRLGLSPDPYCPWCRTVEETIEHFLLHCPRFHSHRVVLRDHLAALGVSTFDLPTLLAAAGVYSSHQAAVIRLTCVFLKKCGQLPRL